MSILKFTVAKMGVFQIQIIIFLQAIVYVIVIADLPKFITKCRPGQGECIATQINKIIKMFPKGNPEIGLLALNAVPHDGHILVRPRHSPALDLTLKVKKQITYGIENTTITRVIGFEKDPHNSNIEIYGTVPRALVIGQYELKGKMFWPFYGGGPFKLEYLNCRFSIKIKVIQLFRNNKTYIEAYDVRTTLDMDRLIINMESIYPDNSDMTFALNQIFSENWREVYNELEKPAMKVLSEEFKDILNNIFRLIPYDDFFIK